MVWNKNKNPRALAQGISLIERNGISIDQITDRSHPSLKQIPVLGITGTGGAGKSSLTDELILRFLEDFPDKTLAVLSVDPSKEKPEVLCLVIEFVWIQWAIPKYLCALLLQDKLI